jgi:hypothetical protein
VRPDHFEVVDAVLLVERLPAVVGAHVRRTGTNVNILEIVSIIFLSPSLSGPTRLLSGTDRCGILFYAGSSTTDIGIYIGIYRYIYIQVYI